MCLKGATAGLALVVVASGHALLIDDFSDGNLTHLVNGGAEAFTLTAASVLGGDRATWIDQTTFVGNRYSILDISAGALSVENAIGTDSISSIGYGVNSVFAGGGFGIDPTSNFNLSTFNTYRLNFEGNDQPLTVFLGLFNSSGSDFVIFQKNIAGGQFSPFSVDITAADIVSLVGTPDYSSIDQVRLDFFTSNAGDFAVTSFEAVPEPATLAVLGLGAAALIRRRRK